MKDLNFNVLKKRSGCDKNSSLCRPILFFISIPFSLVCILNRIMQLWRESAFKRLIDPTCFIDAKHGLFAHFRDSSFNVVL